MNLRDLRYLVALADSRHFGRAAKACHVSQPTLSAQIKKLEDTLGVALVERQPRNVALTEAGAEVVARARRALLEVEAMTEVARRARDPLSGTLRLGLIPTLAPYLLPLAAARLRRELPRLKIMLYEYQTSELIRRLELGELDMAVLALGADLDAFAQRELFEESFLVALPVGHRLAGRSQLKPEDLEGETLLLLEDGHCLRDQALAVCGTAGVHEAHDFRATSLETLRQMVGSGAGITLLPQLATKGPFAAARNPLLKPFAKPQPSRRIGAIWRPSSARRAAIQAVADVLEAVGGER
jgi:LysR family hydrogen peroxide-inducible transcriptional activator